MWRPSKETKTISLDLKLEYFLPLGVIKKPFLYLTEILPDLRGERFVVLSNFEYLIISFLIFSEFIIIFFISSGLKTLFQL